MKKYSVAFIFILFYSATFGNQDTWTQKTSMPAQPRAAAVSFALNGFGYAGTGLDSTGALLDDFWKYDPSNDSWSQVATFAGTPRKNAVAFVTDSFAYVGSGYDFSGLTNDFYKYDDVGNSWLQIEDLDSAGSVYPRRDATSFAIGNTGYVVGGYNGTSFYSNETWEYMAYRDTAWREKTNFPLSGRRWATGFSIAAAGFVGMGFNYSQEYFKDFWKYDASLNTWTQIADYPGNKRAYGVSFVIGGIAFVGAGFDGALKNDFHMYDQNNNQWTQVAAFGGQPISAATAFSVNGKGYLFGGIDTSGYKNELWEYTPAMSGDIEHSALETILQLAPFPNPAKSYFQFENKLPGIIGAYEMKLFDAGGKPVLEITLYPGNMAVPVASLPRGLYFYRLSNITDNTQAVTGKVILQ